MYFLQKYLCTHEIYKTKLCSPEILRHLGVESVYHTQKLT